MNWMPKTATKANETKRKGRKRENRFELVDESSSVVETKSWAKRIAARNLPSNFLHIFSSINFNA